MISFKQNDFKKNICMLAVTFAAFAAANAQASKPIKAYLASPGTTIMTKAEFTTADSISLTCDSCKLRSFTCAITAKRLFKFKPYYGNKIPVEFKDYARNASDSAVVTFEEIKIFDKGIARDLPPFSVTVVK
jgi:hypothetical protein